MFEGAVTRKDPVQPRSRARQDLILKVAEELIVQKGSESVSMSEIAGQAQISIGSLYQYFRDKGAIIAALGLRYHTESTACIAEELSEVCDARTLRSAFAKLMDIYFELLKTSPAMRDVWLTIQSDKALQAIEIDASKRNGLLLAEALQRAAPGLDSEKARIIGFTIMVLGEAAMRVAIAMPPGEADAVIRCYLHMALSEMDRTIGVV